METMYGEMLKYPVLIKLGEFKSTGKSSSVSGAQMRFSTKSLTGRATYSGYGSIY